jgi:actin-related protein 9
MFPAEKEGEWEPFKVNRKPSRPSQPPTDDEIVQEEPEFVEDFETEEDAVWPLVEGKITNWSCFFGLLSYVHSRLGPHLHSPILLVAQPCWTSKDYERLTMFFFEKFKPPGFTIIDSGTTSLWAYNVVNACVVDVGFGKADVTAITDFAIHTPGRGIAIPNCGGEAMTRNLLERLSVRGFTWDMCEQLKYSSICEVLLPGVPLPGSTEKVVEEITNPAAAASTGAVGSGPGQRHLTAALGEGSAAEPGEEDPIENEGVLDVASIVTAGEKKMEEFLARKEKEKAERAVTKKKHSDAAALAAARPTKIRNSERAKATFLYEDRALSKSLAETNGSNGSAEAQAPDQSGEEGETNGEQADPKIGGRVRREVEVGVERLQLAGEIVDRIADAIHLAISSVDDVAKRSDVWDNIILVGNGARVRGNVILVDKGSAASC